jgi:hypothetical protein
MKLLFMLSVSFLFLVSCKKEPDNSKTNLLTAKPWKFVKVESKTNNIPWMDEVPFWPQCKKDDEIVFMKDHSYTLRNGATKCDPLDPDVLDVARWNFLDNETKFDMDGAVTTIEVLNESQFVISASETSGGNTYASRYTLEH